MKKYLIRVENLQSLTKSAGSLTLNKSRTYILILRQDSVKTDQSYKSFRFCNCTLKSRCMQLIERNIPFEMGFVANLPQTVVSIVTLG